MSDRGAKPFRQPLAVRCPAKPRGCVLANFLAREYSHAVDILSKKLPRPAKLAHDCSRRWVGLK
jgi:hypothetical protein